MSYPDAVTIFRDSITHIPYYYGREYRDDAFESLKKWIEKIPNCLWKLEEIQLKTKKENSEESFTAHIEQLKTIVNYAKTQRIYFKGCVSFKTLSYHYLWDGVMYIDPKEPDYDDVGILVLGFNDEGIKIEETY